MNIKTKILTPSLVAVAMMLVLGCLTYLGTRHLQQTLDIISNKGIQQVNLLNGSLTELLEANVSAYRLLSTMANFDEGKIKKETAIVLAHADSAAEKLRQLRERSDISDQDKEKLTEFDAHLAKYRKSIAQAIDMASADISLATGMMQAADKRFLDIRDKLGQLVEEHEKDSNDTITSAIASANTTININIVVFFVGMIIAISVSLLLARRITAPLLSAIDTARSIADGKLTNVISPQADDETGDLLRALDSMQTNLRDLISQIITNAKITGNSCVTMAKALNSINHSVEGQNDATSAVAAAVQQMSVSISNIRDNASQALVSNHDSSELATEGVSVIGKASDEMNRITGAVQNAAEVIERVGAQSNEISVIVSVIRDVADQTNLLALNAAIEAARAGEQGRGFAVVADEVRKLAEKTTKSAQEITRMIQSIQGSANEAVDDIHHVVEQMKTTASYATAARDAIEKIHQSSEASEGFAHDISAALAEQTETSQLIAQQVEGITRMSDENAQSVAHAGVAMHKLEEESHKLNAAVAHFKVDSTH